jgi:flagellar basal body rod protein FlgG
MPIRGILNTARSLSYYLRAQEVTANNLANVSSDAFKGDRLTARQLPGQSFAIPVQKTDLGQGVFRQTGRPLDVALDGPGFLVVATGAGERLTRGGSLQIDREGRLADAHGAPLLGADGPIFVAGRDLEVHGDGTVKADGAVVGRLRLVTHEGEPMRKEGHGRFVPQGALEPAIEGVTRVRQGSVEAPNVDPMLSMVDLIEIQRAYAANLDALKAMDGVLGTVVNQVGRVE